MAAEEWPIELQEVIEPHSGGGARQEGERGGGAHGIHAVEPDAHGRDSDTVGEGGDLGGQGTGAMGGKQRGWQGERWTRWGLVPLSRVVPTASLMGVPIASPVATICRDSFVGEGDTNVEGGESMRAADE